MSYDAIVIGGGPNGLVAASYLARAGRRVVLLDRRAAEGGIDASAGWVPASIVRDLGLTRFGWQPHAPDPWLTIPLPGGGGLELWRDVAATAAAIKTVSPADAARWPEFCTRMARLAALLERLYLAPPPNPVSGTLGDQLQLAGLALRARGLGRQGLTDLFRTLPMSVCDLLDDWFEHDALKGALGAIGVRGVSQGPRAGGTAYVLLHHHVGSPPGVFSASSRNVRAALLAAARGSGVEVRFGAEVTHVLVHGGRAGGVALETGEELTGRSVLSSADPHRTFLAMVDATWLSPEFRHAVANIKFRGVRAIVRLTLAEHPGFGNLTVAPSLEQIERASDDAKYGRASAQPILEAEYTGHQDGRHSISVQAQYAPYRLRDGAWDAARREAFADLVVERLAAHAPRVRTHAIERTVLVPPDVESVYGLTEGNLYHGELTLDQILFMRPVAGWARYRTPVPGLYLCGAGAHPGGGITGAAGRNAARACLAG